MENLETDFIFETVFSKASKWIKLDQKIIALLDRFCRTFGPGKPHFLVIFARTAGCPYPPNFVFERVFLGFLDFDSI